jgi:hypothetical protein
MLLRLQVSVGLKKVVLDLQRLHNKSLPKGDFSKHRPKSMRSEFNI